MGGPLLRLFILSGSVSKHGCHRKFLLQYNKLNKSLNLRCFSLWTTSRRIGSYYKKIFDLFLRFFYWILEMFLQCGILFCIFILFQDKRKIIE